MQFNGIVVFLGPELSLHHAVREQPRLQTGKAANGLHSSTIPYSNLTEPSRPRQYDNKTSIIRSLGIYFCANRLPYRDFVKGGIDWI